MIEETRFRAFYEEMFPRLWRYVHRMSQNRSECDDLVQETFLRFLRTAPDLDEKEAIPYVYRIATNLVRDKWREGKSQAAWLEETGREEAVSPSHDAGIKLDIERAMEKLSPGQRSLVWLAYVEGYDHKSIASIVGVNSTSVRVLLSRARQRLAALLDESDGPGANR
ncbi:MAG: RNA polymerase sigma factor [candidate division Zixibacteria bacterium]|nr:RNA polymerase sigma factor [candidate division Zixibacteria bacterium]